MHIAHRSCLLVVGWRGAPKKKENESDVYLADDKSGRWVPSLKKKKIRPENRKKSQKKVCR
jgi:hypothetical protein